MDHSTAEQLFATYAWTLDTRDVGPLEHVFAEDATYTFANGDEPGTTLEGKAAVIEFIRATIGHITGIRYHVVANVRLGDETDGGIETTAYLIRFVVRDGTLRTESTGVYRFELVETSAGPRFRRCHLQLDLPLPGS